MPLEQQAETKPNSEIPGYLARFGHFAEEQRLRANIVPLGALVQRPWSEGFDSESEGWADEGLGGLECMVFDCC